MNLKLINYLKIILLLGLLYSPIFAFLDVLPIRIWDESRLAVNAYEMIQSKNYLVTQFDGQPDLWNTKPPLMIWAQVISMKILGMNELAVRLPSALAALFTSIGLAIFLWRYFNSFWPGFIAVLILVTTNGYIGFHVTRTGDYDAMLTLFTTMAGLLFFAYTESKKNQYLYLFFLMMALAVLTKGITPLIFAPAFFVYLLVRKQLMFNLTNKHLYYGIGGFLFISLSYYLIREAYVPGYLSAVYNNEISGRYLESIDDLNAGYWIYFKNLKNYTMPYWFWFIIPGLFAGLLTKNEKLKRLTFYSFLLAIIYLLVISNSKTKLNWYDAPALPFIAIIITALPWRIMLYLKAISLKYFKLNVLPFLFLIMVFSIPYHQIISKTYKPKEDFPWDLEFYSMAYVLKDAHRDRLDLSGYHVVYDGYLANIQFYINILKDKGVNIHSKSRENVVLGDQILVHQPEVKAYIDEHFHYELIRQSGAVYFLKILDSKVK